MMEIGTIFSKPGGIVFEIQIAFKKTILYYDCKNMRLWEHVFKVVQSFKDYIIDNNQKCRKCFCLLLL